MSQLWYVVNGQVTDWVFTRTGAGFTAAETASHITDLSAALGIPANQIVPQQGTQAPTPTLVVPAAKAVVPPPTRNQQLATALQALATDPALATATKTALAQAITALQ